MTEEKLMACLELLEDDARELAIGAIEKALFENPNLVVPLVRLFDQEADPDRKEDLANLIIYVVRYAPAVHLLQETGWSSSDFEVWPPRMSAEDLQNLLKK